MRQLGKLTGRWEDNIKMGLKGIRREDGDLVHLCQNRKICRFFFDTVMKVRDL
jgi:hypothetical protein